MKGYAKKWRLAATVDSCKTNCQTRGTCSCSHFQLGLTKVLARLSARKKTCKWRDEQENSDVNWRTMVLWRRLMIRGFGIQAAVQSKRTHFPFYLFASGCAQRQNVTKKTAQSLKKQYLLPSLGLQCAFVERELQNICWPVWKKVEKREHTVNAGIGGYTCFLGRPLNSSSNCSASWAPGGSSLFTQKAVEEVSQHSLIGSPCCRRTRAETCFNCDNNDETEFWFLLTKLLIDRLFYFNPKPFNDANWAEETSPALSCFHCKLFSDLC